MRRSYFSVGLPSALLTVVLGLIFVLPSYLFVRGPTPVALRANVPGVLESVGPSLLLSGFGVPSTNQLRDVVAFSVSLPVTMTVKLDVPAPPVGVPKMRPLAGFSVRPAGSVPVARLHVYGVEPPVAATLLE